MVYFVSGATGYIGSWLVKRLVADGHAVHALVRDFSRAKAIEGPGVRLFKGDVLDDVSIRMAMRGADGVFHLAAFAKVWAPDPKTYFDLNVVATMKILDAARDLGVRRTVVTSTAGVFGASVHQTITEKSARDLDFFNAYESSKALGESKIKDYVIDGLDVVIVSPTRVYGPTLVEQCEAVTLMIEKFVLGSWRIIPSDGRKIGNYVYIDDVVNGNMLAMEKGKKGHTYILGGTNHDYNEFFNVLKKVSGIQRRMIYVPIWIQMLFARFQLVKIALGGQPLITPKWISKSRYDWKVDPSKAIQELGFTITPLEEGLRKTVAWIISKNKNR